MASIFKNSNKIGQLYLERSDDLIFIINENSICEYSNSKYIIGMKKIIDFVFFEDFKKMKSLIKTIFKVGYGTEEIRIREDNNRAKWFEIKGSRFTNDEDNKPRAFLICKDITKFKQIEFEYEDFQVRFDELAATLPEIKYWKLLQSKDGLKAVQKTIEMLELVIEHIPQFIYWKDTNLVYMGCNKKFASINNLKNPSSIIGKTDDDLDWFKNNIEHIQTCERNVILNDSPEYNVIESLDIFNGEQAWFEINRIPLHDPKGKVVGLLATYEDITIRRVGEQKLRESEKKYRSILDNIKEGYFEVDLKGTFTFFNESFGDLFGETRDALMGTNYQKYLDEVNKNEMFKIYNEVYKTGNPNSNFQFQFFKNDVEEITCESSIYLRYDSKGNKIGFSGLARNITEKFYLLQKIKESEKKYRHLFETSTYSIILVNRRGVIIDCNPATEKLFGRRREDLIDKGFMEVRIKPEKMLPLFQQRYKSILKGEVPGPLEITINRSHDGSEMWININDSLVEIGGEVFFQVIIQDITQNKIAEQKLKDSKEELKKLNQELEQKVEERTKDLIKSEQQYRTTIDSLGDPLHVVDRELRIILINKNLKNWLAELKLETGMIGRRISEVFPFLPQKVYEEYKQVFNTGIPLVTIEETILPDHNVITETRKIPIFSEGKVNQMITIIRDITDKKEMENQLIESEENFRNMITNLDEGYYKVELDGKILYHNPAFSKIAGFDPSENLINKNQPFIWQNPEDQDRYKDELMKNGFIRNFTIPIKRFDGETIVVQVNAHLIRDENNNPIAIEGTFAEITEKFRLEQELLESEKKLREQNIELKKLDEIKNDFVTMAAHELKTPLISISGYTDYILIKHRSQLNVEITEDLLTVQRNVKRLEILMDQLLDVLKIDENELKLQKQQENVSMIINDCLNELSYLINEKNLEIILNIDHEIILNIDATRIFAVFTNLISNAIKFTPDYGWIEIAAKKVSSNYIFEIKDNGIGLTEDDIKRLFKKFERIKPPLVSNNINIKDSGTGLGLYITRGIITAHDGEIEAQSEGVNKGSTFSFTLPIT